MFAKAEIGDGHLVWPLIHDYISQFEISMDNVGFVKFADNCDDRVKDDETLLLWEFLFSDDMMLEVDQISRFCREVMGDEAV